jgi:SpoVK/Ycf46/Vps4 family AAA+-type ATPase
LKRVQPSSKREGFATVPDVSWSDVGALENIREELSLAILVSSQRLLALVTGTVYGRVAIYCDDTIKVIY